MTIRLPTRRLLWFAITWLALAGTGACDGCNGCTSQAQGAEMAEYFPKHTEGVVAIPEIEAFFATPEIVLESEKLDDETRQQWEDGLADFREFAADAFGIDPTDPDHWRRWGIDPGRAVVIGAVDYRILTCLPVEDAPNFNAFAVDVLAGDLHGIDEPTYERTRIDETTYYAVDGELAWTFRGDSVCLTTGRHDEGSAEILAEILDRDGDEDTLADTDGFATFADHQLHDSTVGLYFDGDSRAASSLFRFLSSSIPSGLFDSLVDQALGYGLDMSRTKDILGLQLWAGLDEEHLDLAESALSPDRDLDWNYFATDDTTAAMRVSLNPEFIWEQYHAEADVRRQRMAEAFVSTIKDATATDIDVEDELIANLSGHIGVFIYGIDRVDGLLGAGRAKFAQDLELLAVAQFIDDQLLEQTLDALMDAASEVAPVPLESRPLVEENGTRADDIEVIEIPETGFRLHRKAGLVALSTGALSEPEVAEFLRGHRTEDAISTRDTVFGAALEEDEFTGVYATGRVWELLEEAVGLDGMSPHYDEALLRIDTDDSGLTMGLDFSPAGSAIYGIGLPVRDGFGEYQTRSKAAEADTLTNALADGARAYYEGDQVWSVADGAEPWHRVDPDDDTTRPGVEVNADKKVFPGGTNITVKTSEAIPRNGELISPDPVIEGDADFDAEAVLSVLNFAVADSFYFRYTYETGPGTGKDATATIRAEANFDPLTPKKHTVTRKLTVDDSGVQITPPSVTHELK